MSIAAAAVCAYAVLASPAGASFDLVAKWGAPGASASSPSGTTPPSLALGGARRQRVLRQRGAAVFATSSEADKPLTAKITVTASDTAGNKRTATRRLRLVR